MMSEAFEPTLRLHPSSWLFAILTLLRRLLFPVIAVLFLGARNDGALWGLVALVPVAIAAVVRRALFRYGFGPHGLVIHEGLFFRNVRQIDYSRIENIDVERGPLHRLLGVADVRVESSVGGKPEALLRVLSLEDYGGVRERVFVCAQRASSPEQGEAEPVNPPLLRLGAVELVRYGLIDNRGLLLVLAAFGFLQQFGLQQMYRAWLGPWVETLTRDELSHLTLGAQVLFAIATLLALILITRLLSVALALVTLHDFTLSAHGGDLSVRYGLVTRIDLTLRTARIQTVRQTEGPLHRWCKRVSLRVDLAGGSTASEGESGTQRVQWLAPLCPPARSMELIQTALPNVDFATKPDWQPLAPKARTRLFRRNTVVGIVGFGAPAIWFLGIWALLPMLVVPCLTWTHARLYVKHTRWALTPDALWVRAGWLWRHMVITPRRRVQAAMLTRSPFDRHHGMATVNIDTAGAARNRGIRIAYLDAEVARELANAIYRSQDISDHKAPDDTPFPLRSR